MRSRSTGEVWNLGGYATCQRVNRIAEVMPFAIWKMDFDNGIEFLNAQFFRHFKEHELKIDLSRSSRIERMTTRTST